MNFMNSYPSANAYQPNFGNQPMQFQTQQNNQSIMSAVMPIPNEQTARAYPLAPGYSQLFQDESAPFQFYLKAMGRTPLESSIFEKYKLVKEEAVAAPETPESGSKDKDIDLSVFLLKKEIRPLMEQIETLKKDLAMLKSKKKVIREVEGDERNSYSMQFE